MHLCQSQTPNLFFPSTFLWVCFCLVNKFICVFVWLTSLILIISRSIHVAANGIISLFFLIEVYMIYNVVPSQLHSRLTQLYIYILIFLSIMVYPRRLDIVPVLNHRTLLFIQSNSLHLPTQNSQATPCPPPPLPLPIKSLISVWVCFCFVDRFICAIFHFFRCL